MPTRRRPASALLLLAATALAVAAVAYASQLTSNRGSSQISILVDLEKPRQRIQGFGVSVRVFSDPHVANNPTSVVPPAAQAQITAALYRKLGLTRARPLLEPGIQRDPGGPLNFKGKLGDDHIAFVKLAKPLGLKTFFPTPLLPEEWISKDDPGAYAAWVMTSLRYWRSQGVDPPLVSVINEPKLAGDTTPEWMHQVVLELGRRMRAEGFATRIVMPDDLNAREAYARAEAVLRDPNSRKYVAALAYHLYGGDHGDRVRMRDLAARYGLPVWMTEWQSRRFGDWPAALGWAETVHELLTIGGVGAIDYLWGFFGSWRSAGETLLSIDFERGAYRSFRLNAPYYLTGQWSRFVRPGYRRVATSADTGRVLVTAFTGQKRLVVVTVNPGATSESVRLSVPGGRLVGKVTATRTSASESWRRLVPLAARRSGFSVMLPPKTVTTFVVARR